MVDPRIIKAAKILVDWSTRVKKDDYVQIITEPAAESLALEVYKLAIQKGAYPALKISLPGQSYIYYKYSSDEQLKRFPEISMYEMKKTDVVIYIGAKENTRELSETDPKKVALRSKTTQKLSE